LQDVWWKRGNLETDVWEECGRWGAEGVWEEMIEEALGEEGGKWLNRLEIFREGGGWGESEMRVWWGWGRRGE